MTNIKSILDFWNTVATAKGYKPLSEEELKTALTENRYYNPDLDYRFEVNGEIKGFALGVMGDDETIPFAHKAGYITCCIFDDEYEDDKHVGEALDYLERIFRNGGRERAEFSFYNPMRLSWCMDKQNGHEHNNRPGVLIGSKLYEILKRRGYEIKSHECSMHMDIRSFVMPEAMKEREEALRAKGITIDYYTEKDITGIEEFLNRLNNPLWSIQIPDSLKKKEPLIFVSDNGKAAGFTGPTIKEPSGRGYFLGVAVDEAYRGMGIGTLLFHKLCEGFRNAGVEYVTLFTGKENKALEIYKKVGFTVEEEFATMRKKIV